MNKVTAIEEIIMLVGPFVLLFGLLVVVVLAMSTRAPQCRKCKSIKTERQKEGVKCYDCFVVDEY